MVSEFGKVGEVEEMGDSRLLAFGASVHDVDKVIYGSVGFRTNGSEEMPFQLAPGNRVAFEIPRPPTRTVSLNVKLVELVRTPC